MEGLYLLTQKKEMALSHREEVLVESQRIFAEQWEIDWEEICRRIKMEEEKNEM